jgi:hypothetical protein
MPAMIAAAAADTAVAIEATNMLSRGAALGARPA